MFSPRVPLFFALLLAVVSGPSHADLESFSAASPATTFDMEFFSFDGPLRGATASHSFVRLRKLEGDRITEVVDISWLPAPDFFRRRGRVPLLRTVPGHNYSLEETLGMAHTNGRSVMNHGRFEVASELFEAAKNRRNELESGALAYKMLDNFSYPGASNCVHAISGMLAYLRTGLKRGQTATHSLVGFFLGTGMLWPPGQRREPSASPAPPPAFARNPVTPAATPEPPVARALVPPAAPPEPAPAPTLEAPATHGSALPLAQAPGRRRPLLGLIRRR